MGLYTLFITYKYNDCLILVDPGCISICSKICHRKQKLKVHFNLRLRKEEKQFTIYNLLKEGNLILRPFTCEYSHWDYLPVN